MWSCIQDIGCSIPGTCVGSVEDQYHHYLLPYEEHVVSRNLAQYLAEQAQTSPCPMHPSQEYPEALLHPRHSSHPTVYHHLLGQKDYQIPLTQKPKAFPSLVWVSSSPVSSSHSTGEWIVIVIVQAEEAFPCSWPLVASHFG